MKSEEIKKLAMLARLELTDKEISSYSADLARIIDFVDELKEAKTEGIEPQHQSTGLKNVLRGDKVTRDHSFKKKLLELAPKKDGDSVVVRAVLEDEDAR